ncbi:MAG: UDP-N-acetylmuramoyl-tripeptide--D-alanyl-D-alanine ligase [Deltaproteobacteria bacterium]|nr:UDP-N-acetylmuramoyl-tripeptide--D-alanyl-D-alanine ligase [Deltaproteobacteria bacterium]MBW2050673.1 UDP-N-acetylmuramoyl-tripeptide--D-alanyl-D-alanine ligase [Deltaproteobacteria bacterium]MBW2139591.1 UDP-N-acetylmuramoyl-tripeptide--D-alanyl-D-alanine ligase [Deltaproteobacteria bacterium]MBW2323276.1 UDP-N-acetylmuramoyl-tripeptide--D-alanyl-D-alanine ligase [Deltaproteobacteria bacterium]
MSDFRLTLEETVKVLNLPPVENRAQLAFSGVSTDTRTIRRGELFVALKGERFDAHQYLRQAFDKGAAAAVVDRRENLEGQLLLSVSDTLRALGDLAAYIRRRQPLKVVAITGSNGKTTTREMTVRILQKKFNILAASANFNNLIGLPLTLFGLKPEHQIAVLEMGMNSFGEISRLTEIADPDVALVTSVSPVHLEGLGSIEGVAEAKGELYAGLRNGAKAVVNLDDPFVVQIAEGFNGSRLSFGFSLDADVRAKKIKHRGLKGCSFDLETSEEAVTIKLPLYGRHNINNALAAAAISLSLGLTPVQIRDALAGMKPFPGRLELKKMPGPIYLLDDTYNSNPVSVKAALTVLASLKGQGRMIAVLGDMLELGSAGEAAHARIGQEAAEMGLDLLAGVGPLAEIMIRSAEKCGLSPNRLKHFEDQEQATGWLKSRLRPLDRLLIKGSRGMHLEKIVKRLEGEEEF